MFTYILRKLMYMPFILLGVVALTFMLFTVSTKPEALATIQLGEKASARSKYEWLATKGYVEFTERGREKLSKMEKQQIPARGTMLFNASILADLASERDYLKSEIDALAGEDPEDKDVKARLARLEVAVRDGRHGVAERDNFALLGEADAAVAAGGGTGEDGAVGAASASGDRAAPAVEEAKSHAGADAGAGEVILGSMEAPVRGPVTPVLVAVAVSQHDLLEAAPRFELPRIRGLLEKRAQRLPR